MPGPELDVPHRLCQEEGPAEVAHSMSTEDVQPALGAACHLLHNHHLVCSLHIHNSLVWVSHQTLEKETLESNWIQMPSMFTHA